MTNKINVTVDFSAARLAMEVPAEPKNEVDVSDTLAVVMAAQEDAIQHGMDLGKELGMSDETKVGLIMASLEFALGASSNSGVCKNASIVIGATADIPRAVEASQNNYYMNQEGEGDNYASPLNDQV